MNDKNKNNKQLEEYFMNIQLELMDKIKLSDKLTPKDIKIVSGVDLAYWEEEGVDHAVCCIVTLDYNSRDVIEIQSSVGQIDVPYIPGYLSFRELPLIVNTFKKLQSDTDLIMFDGNGYLHYRNMGIATHASFYLNKPTIGIAKSYLKINSMDYMMPQNQNGAFTDIEIDGKVFGRAVRTHKGVKPIFISCGNWITLDTATEIVLKLVNNDSRQPLPTRLADIETRKIRKIITAT